MRRRCVRSGADRFAEVVAAFDLGRFRRLADLGGAPRPSGRRRLSPLPYLRAVVFDLPPVLPLARELIEASGVTDRIELVAGDFFDALPQADLFALGRILHDWGEDKIHRLLRAIYERLPSARFSQWHCHRCSHRGYGQPLGCRFGHSRRACSRPGPVPMLVASWFPGCTTAQQAGGTNAP